MNVLLVAQHVKQSCSPRALPLLAWNLGWERKSLAVEGEYRPCIHQRALILILHARTGAMNKHRRSVNPRRMRLPQLTSDGLASKHPSLIISTAQKGTPPVRDVIVPASVATLLAGLPISGIWREIAVFVSSTWRAKHIADGKVAQCL
jgi:hypothetical protein